MKQRILASFLAIAFAGSLSAKAENRANRNLDGSHNTSVTAFHPPIPYPKLPGTQMAAAAFHPPIPYPKVPGTQMAAAAFHPPIPYPKVPGTQMTAAAFHPPIPYPKLPGTQILTAHPSLG